MPFKDAEKRRAYSREHMRRWRAKNRERNRERDRRAGANYRRKLKERI